MLPLEVLERIIDHVAKYDCNPYAKTYSIKACALTCHSFLPLCRKHIFASVILNARLASGYRICPTSDDLNHLLSNSPHLAVYIRKLDYHFNENEFVTRRVLWLLPMFKSLVRLQKLSISYSPSVRGMKLDWMSSSGRKILLPLLHCPTLTSISLSTIQNFALADLAGCVNLKKMKIQSLECSNGVGKFMEPLPATPAMLERLTINEGSTRLVQQLCDARRPDGKPIIDLCSLKEITARIERLDSISELFGMCRSLHKIDLTSMSLPSLISSSI